VRGDQRADEGDIALGDGAAAVAEDDFHGVGR
jgi:hypothetical protein